MRAETGAFDIFLDQKPVYDAARRTYHIYDAAAEAAGDFNASWKKDLKESFQENNLVQHFQDIAKPEFERAIAAYKLIQNAKLDQAPVDEWEAGDFNDMVAF